MRRGPEAEFRLRAFSCCRCFCWLRTGVLAGCGTGVPGAVGPARPLTVRAASFARRVGSKPGQAAAPPAWRGLGFSDRLF